VGIGTAVGLHLSRGPDDDPGVLKNATEGARFVPVKRGKSVIRHPRQVESPPTDFLRGGKSITLVADGLIPAHSAPLGLVFDKDRSAYVALHGSPNRSQLTGYKIIKVPPGSRGIGTVPYSLPTTGQAASGA
jgi:hypothetical protein